MGNLHAPGMALVPTRPIHVEHLRRGQHVRYNARIWAVHEVLPVAGGDDWAVVAFTEYAPHERAVLVYPRIASADLVVCP